MKRLVTYKIFESSYDDMKSIVDNLIDLSQEFSDNGCHVKIEPSNDIRIKVMALRTISSPDPSSNLPFFIEIITPNETRTDSRKLPDWFIDSCRRIQDYMNSEGYKTYISKRYAIDWENLESVDELAVGEDLIYKVRLEFESSQEILESSSSSELMVVKYGRSQIENCDEMIQDIKDMVLEFSDLGLDVTVGYSPLTIMIQESSPKIVVMIDARREIFDNYLEEIDELDKRLKQYTKSKGFSTGSNVFGSGARNNYQMLIQK
jgi:hypothetical protein